MRAQRTGQKDVFHVKASDSAGRLSVAAAFPRKDSGASLLLSLCMQGQFFDQKFFSTFFLSPDAQEPTGKALPSVAKHSRTPSPELRLGVGDNSTFLRDVSHMRAFCVGSAWSKGQCRCAHGHKLCMLARTRACAHTRTHTHTHTHTHTRMHACAHTHMHARKRLYTQACVQKKAGAHDVQPVDIVMGIINATNNQPANSALCPYSSALKQRHSRLH